MIRRTVTRPRSSVPVTATLGLLAMAALAFGTTSSPVAAQEEGSIKVGGSGSANYELAARFAPYKISDLVHSLRVSPRWIEDTDRFWYEWETSEGRHFYLVDPGQGTKTEIFDNDRIAAELTRITRDPWDAQHLPIRAIRFTGPNTIQFDVESSQDEEVEEEEDDEEDVEEDQEDEQQRGPPRPRTRKRVHHFEYDVTTRTLRELEDYEEPDSHPGWASVSPDTAWVVFSREFNLWMMSYEEYMKIVDARRGKTGDEAEEAEEDVEVEEIQLTTDGEKDFSWGFQGRGQNDEETEEEFKKRQRSGTTWSHDSRYFALTRQDRREVDYLWVVHAVGNTRPKLESYRYDMPGEENVTQTSLHVFDMESREMSQIDDEPWKDQRMGIFNEFGGFGGFGGFFFFGGGGGSTEPNITKWLSDSSDELYFWRRSRDQHRVDVMRADPATGEVAVVIEERLNTYVEHQSPARLENGDLLWWSEQDGWAHLYRYAADGTVRARLTEGPWHVDGLMGVDEERGYAVFRANGREAGEDPYYMHLYRVALDGSGLTLLNPGDYDHQVVVSESARYFIDNYSRVDTNPVSALFDASGRRIMDLETADLSGSGGRRIPIPRNLPGEGRRRRDGYLRGHVQAIRFRSHEEVPDHRLRISRTADRVGVEVVLAEPDRAGARAVRLHRHHDREPGRPPRPLEVVPQLRVREPPRLRSGRQEGRDRAARRPPRLHRHRPRGDLRALRRRLHVHRGHAGVPRLLQGGGLVSREPQQRRLQRQLVREARRGQGGKGLDRRRDGLRVRHRPELGYRGEPEGPPAAHDGDVDNNVHHAGTFRMAEALIRANKRFDFFIFPGQRHGFGNMSNYWFWLRAEYFVKHLLGDSQWNVDILELQGDRPKG